MKIKSHPREEADPVRVFDRDSRLHGSDRGGYRNEAKRPHAGTGRMLAIILKGALIGFTLGLILAVLAGSWVWLEMRVNVGLLIPSATFLCPVFTSWTRKVFSYSVFMMGQVFLLIVLLAIYGFDAGALCAVPAYLFREGFHGTGLTLATAGLMVGGIFLSGNLLWIAFSREHLFPTDTTHHNTENISCQ